MSKSNKFARYSLDSLFGSKTRVKILKFLFRNYPNDFDAKDLASRIQESGSTVKKEIDLLMDIKLIKRK